MSRRLNRVAVAASIVAAAAVVAYGVASGSNARNSEPGSASGTAAPVIQWLEVPVPEVEFRRADGGVARLEDFSGQIVLLNFWGTWCPPCLAEIPHLIKVQESIASLGATVVGPAIGSGRGEDVLRFGREHGMNYPLWLADDATAVGRFGAPGYPFSLLIDRKGVIRARYAGPRTAATFLRDIRALAAEQPAGGS
jgi:thiol-disulfide isomerase/thioredoxin